MSFLKSLVDGAKGAVNRVTGTLWAGGTLLWTGGALLAKGAFSWGLLAGTSIVSGGVVGGITLAGYGLYRGYKAIFPTPEAPEGEARRDNADRADNQEERQPHHGGPVYNNCHFHYGREGHEHADEADQEEHRQVRRRSPRRGNGSNDR